MTHNTKITCTRIGMRMAAYDRTAAAIMAQIPDALIEQLTSAQLILVADAIHTAHQGGRAKAEADVLVEGAIYSPKHGKMLEIARNVWRRLHPEDFQDDRPAYADMETPNDL
jgi:hypothetical protein